MKSTRTLTAYAVIICAIFILGCEESVQNSYTPVLGGPTGELIPEARKIIQEGLADDDPLIRANTIEVIASTKQIKLMPKVERLMQDDFVPVRFAAVLAVGDIEYTFAKDSVKRLLKDENENIRIAADYALCKLGASRDRK